jgi:hypothetical protein
MVGISKYRENLVPLNFLFAEAQNCLLGHFGPSKSTERKIGSGYQLQQTSRKY